MINIAKMLHNAVAEAAPIHGVSIGDELDRTKWHVNFSESATDAQKAAALAIVATYDPNAATADDVDAEAKRRMANFTFAGKSYSLEGDSLINVSGAGTQALGAIINGAQPGDLRWADPDEDFSWIADDNTKVPMDAQTTLAFAQTAAAWRKHIIFKARAIKDMPSIPADYTADSYWI